MLCSLIHASAGDAERVNHIGLGVRPIEKTITPENQIDRQVLNQDPKSDPSLGYWSFSISHTIRTQSRIINLTFDQQYFESPHTSDRDALWPS